MITRDAHALEVGQVCYTPWCDERGKVIDDGTVTRVGEQTFRWTAANANLRWFNENASGLRVAVEDISDRVAALALQGPTSAAVLEAAGVNDIRRLKYFRMIRGSLAGVPVEISRTGYTGDLGYEIWIPWARAIEVWDELMSAGRPFNIRPTGMLALDVARVEAGLLLIDVDFHSSRKAIVESQAYSPFEMGLGRLVRLEKPMFVGREALTAEKRRGSARRIVGLEISWPAVERLYDDIGMAPEIPAAASRSAVPVYRSRTADWTCDDDRLVAHAQETHRARDGCHAVRHPGDVSGG